MKTNRFPSDLLAGISDTDKNNDGLKICDKAKCNKIGEFRAPQSPDHLEEYFWFCLEHVREYNRSWNYYEGMSEEEIEHHIRLDITWQRPTWPFTGKRKKGSSEFTLGPFGIGEWDADLKVKKNSEKTGWHPRPRSPEEEAIKILTMSAPVTVQEIKSQYKKLVKENHPDSNGGDKRSEEKLKSINHAYSVLMACRDIP
ncbi:MAG: DnaJ domain-containing protein [Pseudomonadota bacterium]|nr:DnaJ domain-containing protein [Pseudomonadota bacterium]